MAFQESGTRPPKKKMNWDRLTRNHCPGCKSRKILVGLNGLPGVKCADDCGFMINNDRMSEVVMDILEQKGMEEDAGHCSGCGKPDFICSCYY